MDKKILVNLSIVVVLSIAVAIFFSEVIIPYMFQPKPTSDGGYLTFRKQRESAQLWSYLLVLIILAIYYLIFTNKK